MLCSTEDMHPYECPTGCRHCHRAEGEGHDPATCALCDPDYDGIPNPHRKKED